MGGERRPESEAAWLTSVDPAIMLVTMPISASGRKLRLFGCAACRRLWGLMHDQRCRAAVEASEQFADGLIPENRLDLISAGAEEAFEDAVTDGEGGTEVAGVAHAASYASSPSLSLEVLWEVIEAAAAAIPPSPASERGAQADLGSVWRIASRGRGL